MFLPFSLRTAPRIFNLFAEALHRVFETLYHWNTTHYLDNFLFVFPPGTDVTPSSTEFDRTISKFGSRKAMEKHSDGCVFVHLGFEFDSEKMQVRLLPNMKQRALDAVNSLLSSPSVTLKILESTLDLLSHRCQVVPLGRPFLQNLFSLICCNGQRSFKRIQISHETRNDLRWWH